MKFEMLTSRVEISVWLKKQTGRTTDDEMVHMSVDADGHVEVNLAPWPKESSHARFERHRAKLDVLIDELGVAEWKAIGPEDSEPYLTDEWMERTKELRAVLTSGWQELPLPEGIVA